MKHQFCEQCGGRVPDAIQFCEECGAPFVPAEAAGMTEHLPIAEGSEGKELLPGSQEVAAGESEIRQGTDGTYRWMVEINLLKDTTIIFTVCKILLLACLVPLTLTIFLAVVEGNLMKNWLPLLELFGLAVGIVMAVTFIGYYLVFIPIQGTRYPVVFEMDRKGIRHIQMPKSQDKTQVISWLGIMAGLLAGNPTVVGSNLLAAARKQFYTPFKKVKKIEVDRQKKIIKLVDSDMGRNLIYSSGEAFQMVQEYIINHCSKDVRVKYK